MIEGEQSKFNVEHQAGIDLRIFDPAFRHAYSIEALGNGDEVDAIFYDILTTPAGLRVLGVNQLSKSETEETYDGSTDLKRWQHIAGIYKIVRHFGRQLEITDDEILQYSLVACIPDLGHGVKSHVTDMLKEGQGGTEDFHDHRAAQLVDLGGIQKVFDKYRIASPFDEHGHISIDVPKWIDCPAPGLSVDRLHYINAEASLLLPESEELKEAIKLENLKITTDGEFAFKDIDHARVWAKAANLCSSEHWNDPTNRLIELLSLEGMKRTISKRYLENIDNFDNGYVGPPEDYTFLIDQDFDDALKKEALSRRPDLFMNTIYSLIQSIAHGERQRFTRHKKPAYLQYLADSESREYPNALINPHRAAFGIPPAQVEILHNHDSDEITSIPPQDAPLTITDGRTVGVLKKLKFRQFDPKVMKGDEAIQLSEIDENFHRLLVENGQALNYVGSVALHANPEAQAALIEGVEENAEFMKESKSYKPLSPDQIRGIFKSSANRALELSIQKGTWQEL